MRYGAGHHGRPDPRTTRRYLHIARHSGSNASAQLQTLKMKHRPTLVLQATIIGEGLNARTDPSDNLGRRVSYVD